jgi:hypothetical protein
VLEYDNVLVRLSGSYDRNSGNWSVSARYGEGDSEAIYTIDGSVDNGGDFRGAGATIVVPDDDPDEWAPAFFQVTKSGATWSPAGEPVNSKTEGGMPSVAHGYWSGEWDTPVLGLEDAKIITSVRCVISDWKIKIIGTETRMYGDGADIPVSQELIDQNQTIIEVTEEEDGSYTVISCYPEYVPTVQDFAAALTEYLELGAEDIEAISVFPETLPEGRWVYQSPFDRVPTCVNFLETDNEKLLEFYAVNGWEAWAVENGVEPEKKYAQYKFVFDGDNAFKMVRMIGWLDGHEEQWAIPSGNHYTYDSLADLKDAELHEEHKIAVPSPDAYPIDTGVFEMPFTR